MGKDPLPSDDEVVRMWKKLDQNNSATARHYGVNESSIRKRVARATGRKPKVYTKLPVTGRQLHGALLKEGVDRGAIGRLAASYGVKSQSVRAALRRYFEAKEDGRA